MGLLRFTDRIIVFIVVTATIGLAVSSMKGDFLWPMISSCPVAISQFLTLTSQLSGPDALIQNVWNCGVGIILFIALPGIGISWFITKHVI